MLSGTFSFFYGRPTFSRGSIEAGPSHPNRLHLVLSKDSFTGQNRGVRASGSLPIHSHLFGVCHRSAQNIRNTDRNWPITQENLPVPSVGWLRTRSGAEFAGTSSSSTNASRLPTRPSAASAAFVGLRAIRRLELSPRVPHDEPGRLFLGVPFSPEITRPRQI